MTINNATVSNAQFGVLEVGGAVVLPPQEILDSDGCDMVPSYSGGEIVLRDAQDGDPRDAAIRWHHINVDGREVCISDRPLLRSFSQSLLKEQGLLKGREIYLFGGKDVATKFKMTCMTEEVWDDFVLNKLGLRHLPQPDTLEHRKFWNTAGHFIMTDRTTKGGEAVLMDGSSPWNRGYLRCGDSSFIAALVLVLERIG